MEGENGASTQTAKVGFPYFGGIVSEQLPQQRHGRGRQQRVGAYRARANHPLGKEGDKREALVATVFDLQVANYGVARGLAR
jgi:nitrate reductase alpha subunit